LLAFALVIPTYITFFIGKESLMQGLAFSLYLIPLGVAVVGKRITLPSFKLSAFWVIFLFAWIVPSLINAYGSHLESDLVRLPVLFFHTTILTALVFIFYDFLKSDPQKQLQSLLSTMFWVMLPMALLIFLKVCYLKYFAIGPPRPSPFGIHPTIAAEVLFTFLICATQARQGTMRWVGYLLAIATIFMVQGRGALISCYIVLIMIYGYARVSTSEQELTVQEEALKAAGCEVIRSEKVSGTSRDGRSELQNLMDFTRQGDAIVVTRIDRLARSVRDLQNIVYEMNERGVTLRATEQSVDTSTSAGKCFLDMLSVFAEFETNLRKERQMEGIKKAKEKGVYKGRRRSIDIERVRQMREEGQGATAIARHLDIDRTSVYRVLKDYQIQELKRVN